MENLTERLGNKRYICIAEIGPSSIVTAKRYPIIYLNGGTCLVDDHHGKTAAEVLHGDLPHPTQSTWTREHETSTGGPRLLVHHSHQIQRALILKSHS